MPDDPTNCFSDPHLLQEGNWQRIVDEHLDEDRWRDCFLRLVNLVPAVVLLKHMVAQANRRLLENTPAWAKWICRCRKSTLTTQGNRIEAETELPEFLKFILILIGSIFTIFLAIMFGAWHDSFIYNHPILEVALGICGAFSIIHIKISKWERRTKARALVQAFDLINMKNSNPAIHGGFTDETLEQYESWKVLLKNQDWTIFKKDLLEMDLSETKNREGLNRYFSTLQLIVDCKRAAYNISPKDWDEVVSQML